MSERTDKKKGTCIERICEFIQHGELRNRELGIEL
jgi:hypothetical protein